MQYLGGKHRQGRAIAEVVLDGIKPGSTYIEPFCGAMGAARRVAELSLALDLDLKLVLSDSHDALINMWNAVLFGWNPPSSITEEEHAALKKKMDPKDPRTAFAGYGCSFAAKFFGTYARHEAGKDTPEFYAIKARNAVLAKAETLLAVGATVVCRDYRFYKSTVGATIYLDPPYAGRTKQRAGMGFDHAEFWDFARALSKKNRVFVTEFVAPGDFKPVHSFGDTVVRHYAGKGSDGTEECIFVYKGANK